jgi:hypothetical protein
MTYSVHGSNGTPDLQLATEGELADGIPGYYSDEGSTTRDEYELFLVDHGNQVGWAITLPGGSDDLFAFAVQIEALAQQLADVERNPENIRKYR